MDQLEQYLDRVCRGIAGPRSLRRHIREELREHLKDAAAEHRAAGLSEEEAIARAIADFGGPEQVGSELQETHGHRAMAVIIDKAMQWKETTMKAKWLWTAWAHLAFLGVIAAELFFLFSAVTFILPKYQQMMQEGLLGTELGEAESFISWSNWMLNEVVMATRNVEWWAIPLAALWLIFEWRSRSEHKPFIRLAGLGTAALALAVVVVLTAAALVLPLTLAVPTMAFRSPEPVVDRQVGVLEEALNEIEQDLAKEDWHSVRHHLADASHAAATLARMGSAAPALMAMRQPAEVEGLRNRLRSASEALRELRRTDPEKDVPGLRATLREVQEVYSQLGREPTTRPGR